jgi:hypothetical protein
MGPGGFTSFNVGCRILFNRLKFSTVQAYFITLCDGLKFADSTADVTDDA